MLPAHLAPREAASRRMARKLSRRTWGDGAMSHTEDLNRLTQLLREIHACDAERPNDQAMFEAMVRDLAKKLAVSEERVCEMIGVSHGRES